MTINAYAIQVEQHPVGSITFAPAYKMVSPSSEDMYLRMQPRYIDLMTQLSRARAWYDSHVPAIPGVERTYPWES